MNNINQNNQEIYPRFKDSGDDYLSLKNWYSETFDSNFTMDFHTHPQYEIMYCENGQFDFVYKKDKVSKTTETVTVGNNCFILINNGYYHQLANLYDSTKILNLEFLPSKCFIAEEIRASQLLKRFTVPLKNLYSISPQLKKIMTADQDFYIFVDNNNILNTMREILRKTEEQNAVERALDIALLTNKLFLDIAHCSSPVGYKKTGIIYVDSAMTYINSNFLRKLTVKEIANNVGVSDVYLQKMFKEQYGKTIHRIITEKRIVQAKYLLEHSDANTSIIASSCGFGSCEDMVYAFVWRAVLHLNIAKTLPQKQSNSFHIRGKSKFIRESKKRKPWTRLSSLPFLDHFFAFSRHSTLLFFTNIDMLNRLDTKCASSYNV